MKKLIFLLGLMVICFAGCNEKDSRNYETYIYEERIADNNLFRLVLRDYDTYSKKYFLEYSYTDEEDPLFSGFIIPDKETPDFVFFSFKDCYGNHVLACLKTGAKQKEIILSCEKITKKGSGLNGLYGKTYLLNADERISDLYDYSDICRQKVSNNFLWFLDNYRVDIREKNDEKIRFTLTRYRFPYQQVILQDDLIAQKKKDKYFYQFDYTDGFENEAYGYMILREETDGIDIFIDCKRIPETGNVVWNLYDGELIHLQRVKAGL